MNVSMDVIILIIVAKAKPQGETIHYRNITLKGLPVKPRNQVY
jgi:hypothetical protein